MYEGVESQVLLPQRLSSVGGIFLPLFFSFANLFGVSLTEEFFNYEQWATNADKVYSGTVIEILDTTHRYSGPVLNIEQKVRIEVFSSWLGEVAEVEELTFLWDSIWDFQPTLIPGRDVIVFAKRYFSESLGKEIFFSSFKSHTIQEFKFGGSELIEVLNYLYLENEELEEVWLSCSWFYTKFLGLVYNLGDNYYVSDKLGFIYCPQRSLISDWIYHFDLGWVFSGYQALNWIWIHNFERWIFVDADNSQLHGVRYYDIELEAWKTLSQYSDWHKLGV